MSVSTPIVAEPTAPFLLNTDPVRYVRLFRNGANQAIRIPKEFELPGKEATLRREGSRLILEAIPDRPKKGTGAALLAALHELQNIDIINEDFPNTDEGLLPLDSIHLLGE